MFFKTLVLYFNKEQLSLQPVSSLQNVLCSPSASASPGNLLETEALRLYPRTADWDSASQQPYSVRNICLFNNIWGWGGGVEIKTAAPTSKSKIVSTTMAE